MGAVDESVLDAAMDEVQNEPDQLDAPDDGAEDQREQDVETTDVDQETTNEPEDQDKQLVDSGDKDDANKDEGEDQDKQENKDDQTPELTNEQLMAELEKRGLKVVDKNDEPQKDQRPQEPAEWERRPKEVDEEVWDRMPAENKFIYNNLPTISVRDKSGEVYHVKTPEQLPDDFEPINDKERTRFNTEMQSQNARAEDMMRQINAQRESRSAESRQQAEDKEIADGINKLMEDGIIPEIKAAPNSPEFQQDTGAIIGEAILQYRNQLRAQGENVSMYMAGKLFRAEHPEFYGKVGAVEKKPAPTADNERKKASKNIAGKANRGTKSSANFINTEPVQRFAPGTSITDIAALYADELDD